MNIAFAGFRHSHIYTLYDMAVENKNINIIGCFEENNEAREKAKTDKGIDFNYATYEDVLCDKSVEAVVIGDYYGKRGKVIIEALKCGKHIICDKPICTSLSELDEIARLTKEKSLKVICMLDMRVKAQVLKATELLKEGKVGELINITFTGQHCLDYGNRPSWYYEEGKHGGTLNDIAIHGIDVIRCMTGENLTCVNFAKVWNGFATSEPQFCDCGQLAVEMGKIHVLADVSYAAPKCNVTLPTYWDFYLWGKKGLINFRNSDSAVHVYTNTKEDFEVTQKAYNFFDDYIAEIRGEAFCDNTSFTLESQRQVLLIQKKADENL